MKTISVKVPEELDLRLTEVAKKLGESKSQIIRIAIEKTITSKQAFTANSCLDLAKDLVGSVEAPADLSHNKKHLTGYGQ